MSLSGTRRVKRTKEETLTRDELGRKVCIGCGEWHFETLFCVNSKLSDKLNNYCISCMSVRGKEYRESRNFRDEGYWKKQKWYEALKAKTSWRIWKEKAVALYGSKCTICGFSDTRALQFDHVNDDGYADRKTRKSLSIHPREIHNDATGKFQLLCANCNWIKRSIWDKRRGVQK
jgi:hypothetical protein